MKQVGSKLNASNKKINKNKFRDNSKRIDYTYQSGNLVLLKNEQNTKFDPDTYQGPWDIKSAN